jgi:hypothetical protein
MRGYCKVTCNGSFQWEYVDSYDELVHLLQQKYGQGYLGYYDYQHTFVSFENELEFENVWRQFLVHLKEGDFEWILGLAQRCQVPDSREFFFPPGIPR